ncbi:unnamed protein product, partial [Polarella glacialis]
AGSVASLGLAFHEGLWWPLLRDAQDAKEAASECPGRLPAASAALLAKRISEGAVVVVDSFLSSAELAATQRDLALLAAMPGVMELNPKALAGDSSVRTDKVCYLRAQGDIRLEKL